MLRRRNVAPPYEVMRTTPPRAGGPTPSSTPEPSVVHRAPTPTAGGETPTGAWGHFNTPVLLRLPRGLIALLGVVLAAVLVLSYWVGHSMGARAERERARLADASESGEVQRVRGTIESPGAPTPPVAPSGDGQGPATAPADPSGARQAGYNYLVLARYQRAEDAKKLTDYLARNGVAAEIIRDRMSGPFLVVAMQGFASGEFNTAAKRQFESRVKSLGRKWKQEEKGSSDLQDAYWDKYEGG